MQSHTRTPKKSKRRGRRRRNAASLLAVLALVFGATALLPASASASKQAVDFFGGQGSLGGQFVFTGQVAVNYSGAGGVPSGTFYVTDPGCCGVEGNRINRFQRDDNGTPADTTDDSYGFISTWGAGIEGDGSDYQVCTTAADCEPGIATGGNGALSGDGSLDHPGGIAVDQDTGEVYVADAGGDNNRINVYSATGTFLRSFGWDVVESGPDDNGTGYEVCVAADGDICKAGLAGAGVGQLGASLAVSRFQAITVSPPDGNPATGTVFFADASNQRVDAYNLDGSSPAAIGSAAAFGENQPKQLAVDSRGILYASNSKNSNQIERYDTENANGAGAGFLSPISSPPLTQSSTSGLAVDPDSDGPGPDSDVLYVSRGNSEIQQFGPLNPAGLTTPPSAVDDTHGTAYSYESTVNGLAVEPPTGRLYVALGLFSPEGGHFNPFAMGVFVLDNEGPSPTATLDSISDVTASSATAHATIDPNGPPNTSYHFEYSTDQVNWTPTPAVVLGHQEDPQEVQVTIGTGAGLHPDTHYFVRLIAGRRFGAPIVTPALDFTTTTAPPIVETVGSPIRTATSALLSGRVTPRDAATEYHFEYGDQGPCDANPCTATEPHSAGSGDEVKFVSQQIEELQPGTTYHYRVIADNGNVGGPAIGADMIVTTRASDAPLSHGHFPGPPGSDRAYEQVSLPDTGGNPVFGAFAVSDDGDRAFYRVSGGTPLSGQGSLETPLYAERSETGPHQGAWLSRNILPPRPELIGSAWLEPAGSRDLSEMVTQNVDTTSGLIAVWRLRPGQPPVKLLAPTHADYAGPVAASEDASRVLILLRGPQDPAHPPPNNNANLYDISTGTPHLVGLMPDGSVPSCGTAIAGSTAYNVVRASHWVSPDGSLAFFQSCNNLYLRDFDAEETKPIGSKASFVKSTPGAAFFVTGQSLAPGDSGGADLYRYDIGDESLKCVTCVAAGLPANVNSNQVVVSEDGSRVYFASSTALIPGAATPGIYRVDVADGDLAYVAPAGNGSGDDTLGDLTRFGNALTADGSALVFASAKPDLNALGGQQNGATVQFYRYEDRDRSLVCLSCPQDGSAPAYPVSTDPASVANLIDGGVSADDAGANRTPLSADGSTFAFSTPNALLPADQNTARPGQNGKVGTDVYEWRDGRLLLVSDGLANWPDEGPLVSAMSPSGKDIFFTAAAQYTQDALDGYRRLYDARIGGGFEVPPAPKPCPLEVCQGTPKGAPEEQAPGSGAFAGPGNAQQHAQHKKKPKKHAKRKSHKKQSRDAKHNRRTPR